MRGTLPLNTGRAAGRDQVTICQQRGPDKKFSDLLTDVVKRIIKKYKYPPDKQESAIGLVSHQANVMGEPWVV
jgi:hypothetical protein